MCENLLKYNVTVMLHCHVDRRGTDRYAERAVSQKQGILSSLRKAISH